MKGIHLVFAAVFSLALASYVNADTVDLSESYIDTEATSAPEAGVKPRALKGVNFFNFVDSFGEPSWPVELEVELIAMNGESYVACRAIQCLLLTSNALVTTPMTSWSL